MMTFLYPFLTFAQPADLWTWLAPFKPTLVLTILAALVGAAGARPIGAIFQTQPIRWLTLFVLAQMLSVHAGGVSDMLSTFSFWNVYLLFVIISVRRLKDEEELRRFIWGMILGSMIIVVYGIYAVFAGLPCAVQGRAGAYGLYENHNDYSFIIVMVLPFIYMQRRFETKFLRKLFLGLSLLACVLGIFLSLSRGGILALVVELVMIVVAAFTGFKRVLLIIVMLMFGGGAIGYQWAKRAANQGSNYTAEDAESSRYELWRAGANMVKAKPLLGVGSRKFGEYGKEYAELSHDQLGKNAHNTYIDVIACSGLLGFIPFVLMLRAIIRELRQKLTVPGHEWLDAMRSAGLIGIWSILFRSLLDAKEWDLSFYVFCVMAVAYRMLRLDIEREPRASEDSEEAEASPFAASPARFAVPGLRR